MKNQVFTAIHVLLKKEILFEMVCGAVCNGDLLLKNTTWKCGFEKLRKQ